MPTPAKSGKNKGLGKGFDVLLPQGLDAELLMEAHERIQKIRPADVQPNKGQPRKFFDEEALIQLAESIKRFGVLQPIIVTLAEDNGYILVAGERRLRAVQMVGLETIPAIVRTHKELERLEIALVENVQRVDLSPLEQASSVERLHQQFNLTYDTIAQRLGKAVSTVTNLVRLLQLPKEAKEALNQQKITEGHARQIVAIKDYPAKQKELLELIVKNGWSVRQAERFVTAFKKSKPGTDAGELQKKIHNETPETKQLGQQIKAPVSIYRTAKGGRLEIGFNSDEDLQRIIDILLALK